MNATNGARPQDSLAIAVKFAGETPEQIKAHRRIARRHAWLARKASEKRGGNDGAISLARLRLPELERLYEDTLPGDDAGREDLLIVILHHIVGAGIDVLHRCVAWLKRWEPRMSTDAARAVADKVIANPLRFKAATLGKRLRLTDEARTRLKIRTIRAIDATETPMERKRRLDRERNRRKRADARAARQAESKPVKPWEAEGISRAKWYRRRKAAVDVRQKPVASILVTSTRDAFLSHRSRRIASPKNSTRYSAPYPDEQAPGDTANGALQGRGFAIGPTVWLEAAR